MASSSTSFQNKSFKYDVFLSFRGEDTRANFVDHLYHALQQKGIRTYKDDERITKGKQIYDELIGSIEDSKFYIIVFSKNYASSSWCLDELVKIIECHKNNEHTAYPVFYDVEPTEVRNQSGAVKEAFAKHENEVAAGKWRMALKEAAILAGWELKNTADGHEAKFIQKVVEELSLELRAINFNIDKKLVGMETRINGVLSSLGTVFDDVRMVGIKGMGGGGKTSLARAVFNQISFQFEGKSFVEKVREVSKASSSGLNSLQNQILSDVFKDKGMSISSVHEGICMMKKMMHAKKVLLVLDDVDHREQRKALAGEMTWFKPGSIIIITTRDRQVLEFYEEKLIHDVQLLSDKDAMCLFRRYAFGKVIPNTGYEELSQKFVQYAAGLPLAVEVLGSFLCGKDEREWMDALLRLKTIPSQEILEILEISYSGLENDYKEIFLDVACLLKGRSKDDAIKVLESCGYYARTGLRVLEQKSLITVDSDGYLGMHDHIEEMGKNIVRRSHPDKPNKHSRLWIHEEIRDVLSNDLGSKAIRYIQCHTEKLSPEVVIKGLVKIKELRYLDVFLGFLGAIESDCSPQNWKSNKFPNALRYLCWKCYPFRSLPETFQADYLVTLKMTSSKIVQLWEGGERKVLNKLRFLDLSYSMLRTLDLGLTPNIETLNLTGCADLVDVHMLAQCLKLITVDLSSSKVRTLDLGSAPNLELLNLERCFRLVELKMPGKSPNMRSLILSDSKIRTLDIGLTPNLEVLNLFFCEYMEELHMAGEYLEKLVQFDITGSLRFTYFHWYTENKSLEIDSSIIEDESLEVGPSAELSVTADSLDRCALHPDNNLPMFRFGCFYTQDRPLLTGNLKKLISVGPCDCTNVDTLSRSICGLQCLRRLKLYGSIPEVPKDLDQLEYLEKLELSHTNIKNLPDNICMLTHLKYLHLDSCSLLEKLPEDLGRLECLKELSLSSAKIKDLPDGICMLKHLESLELMECSLLEKLPKDVGLLECLKTLRLSYVKIKDLPDNICNLKLLEIFELEHCSTLEKLPEDIGRLECLRKLTLSFVKIKDIPDSICMLKHLESLELEDCSLLEKLPEDLGRLDCLKNLNLCSTKIKVLPDSTCRLKHLVSLKLHKCLFLEKLPQDLGQLECLEELNLSYCELLRDIPDSICEMKCLKHFSLYRCFELQKLPEELGRLEFLKTLDLRGAWTSHLPQSMLLLERVYITPHVWELDLSDAYCYVWVWEDDIERLESPEKENQN